MRNAIAGVVVGLLALTTGAQEPPRGNGPIAPGDGDRPTAAAAPSGVYRLTWEHAEGLCQFVDKGEENWVEVDKKAGTVSFRFKETRRNCDFVELLDRDRGLTVRLYKDALFIKGVAFEDFTKYYDGRWVK